MEQRGAELVGLRSNKALEFIEGLVGLPIGVGAGFVCILVGEAVILADLCGGVAITLQIASDGGGSGRNNAVVAGETYRDIG